MKTSTKTHEGHVALITGAGQGIGQAIALALAAAGAELVLVSRTKSQLDEVACEIASAGGTARVLPFDVTDTAAAGCHPRPFRASWRLENWDGVPGSC